ncbi:hypothetical protein Pcinc_009721 [Petrolisthes cinctipes]|uniref:C2H2-type domain-containing protein n=1 Tax=Petrolisthes cinctipes TaxID=88211 RepID=A0AAE1G6H3_PETCI|nr:hypothetical protein Pcinc_009721 [Petrolisthes cinctipes]
MSKLGHHPIQVGVNMAWQESEGRTGVPQEDKLLYCPHCSYTTLFPSHLKNHAAIHTGEKPFSCPICPYRAKLKHHLKKHIRIHTGEKPYACSFCSYRAKQTAHLASHVNVWHRNIVEAASNEAKKY